MAQYCLRENHVREAQVYLASLLEYPGKVRIENDPTKNISSICKVSKRTVRRSFKWLLKRDWMGKDITNGWFFFRGLNWVHQVEEWKYCRGAILQSKDLSKIKSFLIGTVISSLVKTGRVSGTGPKSRGPEQSRYPISLSTLMKVLKVSRSTAYNYRNMAEKLGYIKMEPNLHQVMNLVPEDIKHIKKNNIKQVSVDLFGSPKSIHVSANRLRIKRGYVHIQRPNIIYPMIHLKKR